MPLYRTPSGSVIEVDDARGRGLGYEPVDNVQYGSELAAQGAEDARRESASTLRSLATGAWSGATAGLSDIALGALSSDNQRAALQADLEYHPVARTAAEIGGSIVGAFGAGTPAGVLSSFTASQAEKGAGRALAAMGAEGAAYASGQYLGHAALTDKEATAEGLIGAAGLGFGFGAAAGGAALGVAKGTMSARKMFSPGLRGGEKAATDATVEFERVGRDILDAHESAANAARAELDALRAERIAAQKQAHLDSVAYAREQAAARLASDAPAAPFPEGGAAGSIDELIAGSPGAQRARPNPTEAPYRPANLAGPSDVGVAPYGPSSSGNAALDQAFGSAGALAERLGERNLVRGAPALADEVAAPAAAELGVYVPKTQVARGGGARPVPKDAVTQVETQVGGAAPRSRANDFKHNRVVYESPELAEQIARDNATFAREELGDIAKRRKATRSPKNAFADQEAPLLDALERSVALGENARGAIAAKASKREIELEALLEDLTAKRGRMLDALASDPEVAASAWFKDVKPPEGVTPSWKLAEEPLSGRANDVLGGKPGYMSPEQADQWYALKQMKDANKRVSTGTEALEDVSRAKPALVEGTPSVEQGTVVGKKPRPVDRLQEIDQSLEQVEQKLAGTADDGEKAWLQREAERLADEANAIEEKMAGGDIAGQARRITEYEEAANKVADAMGQTVDPKARELMKAFQDAQGEASRKVMERIGRAADDAQAGLVAARERAAASKLAAKEAKFAETEAARSATDAQRARDAVFKKDAQAEKAALREQRANSARSRFSSPNSWANVGSALELGDMAGMDIPGIPKPHDLPVVGPLLGLWLKLRVAKGMLDRGLGRVSATADARVAAAASRTQSKIATAVDGMFEKASPKIAKAAQPLAVASALITRRVFDDGYDAPSAKATIGEHAAARAREIQAYVASPNAIENDVRRELAGVVDPDVIAATEKQRRAHFQYLADNAPKVPPSNPLNPVKYEVPPSEALKFGRRMAVINDPSIAFEAAQNGTLTVEMSEALRAGFPRLYELAQLKIADMIGAVKEPIPYRKRAMMTLLFDTPLDPSLDPRNLRIVQSVYAPPAGAMPGPGPAASPPVPSLAGDVNINQYYATAPNAGRR